MLADGHKGPNGQGANSCVPRKPLTCDHEVEVPDGPADLVPAAQVLPWASRKECETLVAFGSCVAVTSRQWAGRWTLRGWNVYHQSLRFVLRV